MNLATLQRLGLSLGLMVLAIPSSIGAESDRSGKVPLLAESFSLAQADSRKEEADRLFGLGIEQFQVSQILAQCDRVEVVDANGQTETDYLLGRFDTTAQAEIQPQTRGNDTDRSAIENGSIGLFSNSLDPLPSTFGSPYEEIGSALERLSTRFRLLLASGTLRIEVGEAS